MENEIRAISPITEISEISDSTENEIWEIADSMDYRGFHVDFYEDPYGKQVFTYWNGEKLTFGTFNTVYRDDMKLLIDDKLDVLYRFPGQYLGARLTKFNNGGFTDIALIYGSRILKVFLVVCESEIGQETLTKLISESESIMRKLKIGES